MTDNENFKINNEQEFQELMESIDKELREKGISIAGRPIKASLLISGRYGMTISSSPFRKIPTHGIYENFDLGIRIKDWFENRYGNKLKIDPTWKMAILIKDDAFILRLPLTSGKSRVNIFDLIDDLTSNYANSLNQKERESIVSQFNIGLNAKLIMQNLTSIELLKLAKSDIDAAVHHIFTTPPNYNLSKWASLQATEKTIKAFIERKGKKFQYIHKLAKLATDAEKVGLKQISRKKLQLIQCEPEIRYQPTTVNLVQAVKIHQTALEICFEVAEQISQLNN